MATRHNLCLNPALGVDVTGWGGGSTPARTAVTGFARPWAARYVAGTFMSTAATSSGAVTTGVDYTLAVQLRVATFAVPSGVIYVEWINAGGSGFGYPSAGFTASIGIVTRVSITATAPANAVAARVVIDGINYNINATDFTALLIEQTGTLGTYFDGDSPSASWDGTAGLSSSTLTDTQISAVTARSTLALSGATSARKLAPAAGQATAGLAGTSAARKISPIAAANLIALAASGAGRKISPVISTAAAALTGSSTARKNTPAEGRAAVALAGTAAARRITTVTGRGVLLLTTRMANVSDPGLPVFAVGPPQLRWHAGPPRIGRP